MAFLHTPVTLYLYGLSILAAIILMSVSLGTHYWVIKEYQGETVGHSGLFVRCLKGNCKALEKDDLPVWVLLVTCACVSAILLYVATLLIMGHLVFVKKMTIKRRTHGWLTMWISFAATLIASLGPVDFLHEQGLSSLPRDYTWHFGYSLYLPFISSFVAFWAGVFAFMAVSSMRTTKPMNLPDLQLQPVSYPIYVVAPEVHAYPAPPMYSEQNSQGYPNQASVPFEGDPPVYQETDQPPAMDKQPLPLAQQSLSKAQEPLAMAEQPSAIAQQPQDIPKQPPPPYTEKV